MRRILMGALLLLLPLVVGLQAQGGERRWALVVGVDRYHHHDLIPSLQCAVADAREFARALVEVGGFAQEDVYLLTSEAKEVEGQATKGNIAWRLEWLLGQADEDDLVVFYFAGHGITRQGKGYLLTQEADPRGLLSLELSCLGVEWVQGVLRQMRSRKVVMFIDACRSEPVKGEGSRGEAEGLTEAFARGLVVQPKAGGGDAVAATFFACAVGQKSYEWGTKGHGYFTYYLLEGLRGGAADEKGEVTLAGLGRYLTERVPARVREEKGQEQVPWPQMEGPGQYRVVLGRGGEGGVVELPTEGRLRVTSEPAGAVVRVEGEEVGKTPCEVEVDLGGQGRRVVEVVVSLAGYRSKRGRVELEVGRTKVWAVGVLERLGAGPGPAGPVGQTWVNPVDGAEMVWIPGGEFLMGSPEGQGDSDEHPQHRVRVEGFWLYKYEVTVAQYRKFCRATGREMPEQPAWNKDNHPVVSVTWYDAKAYCDWAGVRLPTEAEWEYAARGGRGYEYGTADGTVSHDLANYWGTGGRDRWEYTSPVGSFPPNPFGVYDLSGNVWEWCSSIYRPYPYDAKDGRENIDKVDENVPRVLRGGSWGRDPNDVRAANRGWFNPAYGDDGDGFRGAASRL